MWQLSFHLFRNFQIVFQSSCIFTFPLTMCKFSNLSTSSPTCYCWSFNFNNPSGCQVILIWISWSVNDVGHHFICLLAICISSLYSRNVLNPLLIFHLGCLFCCWVVRALYIFWWWWCLVAKLCLTLWNLMDCSLSGSSVHGILVAFLRWSFQSGNWTCVSCIGRLDSLFKSFIRYKICKYFLPFCGWFYFFFTVSFEAQKLYILIKPNLFFLLLFVLLVC